MVTQLLNQIKPIISNYLYIFIKRIIYLLELQLFIIILALPIFLSWGLPISILSPLGNLIFGPWLIIFLTLSSLIFFLQILCIDNSFIIFLLEKLNLIFFGVLDFGNKSFMVSCPCPGNIFLFLIPISLFFIIKFQKSYNIYLRPLILFLFSSFLFFLFKFLSSGNIFEYITNKHKTILLIKNTRKNVLFDFGALSEGHSANIWCRCQLIPHLLKLGIDHLDCLIIPKPSSKIFESILELSKNIPIKHIYLQNWTGFVPNVGWKCWKTILDLKNQKQLTLTFLNKPLNIKLDKNFLINIKPTDTLIRKGPLKYNELEIELTLNQQNVNLNY